MLRERESQPRVPVAPRVGAAFHPVVLAALRVIPTTCLARSIVRQEWLITQGQSCDLLVGVSAGGQSFKAHAWLEGDPPYTYAGFVEVARRAPGDPLFLSEPVGADG